MRGLSLGTLLVALLFAAGCGGGGGGGTGSSQASGEASKPASEVVADAVKAADGASSVHMSGTVVDGGQTIGVDMTIAKDKGAKGTLSVGKGGAVDLVVIGGTAYIRASPAFWKKYTHSSAMSKLFADQWLKFKGQSADLKGLTELTDAQGIFDQLKSGEGKLTNQGATTYEGQDVVAINDTPTNGTLYVAASGTPYPVGLVKKASTGGKLTFDHWNEPVTLTAPKGALDFSHFSG